MAGNSSTGLDNPGFVEDEDKKSVSTTSESTETIETSETINKSSSTGDGDSTIPIDEDDQPEEIDRQIWDNPIEFLFSCISMSVGLGNIWRFPTTAFENGGGAFLIPYFVVLMLVGRPMYFLELSIGQFSSCSVVKLWKMVPAVKGLGYAQAIATFCVVTYYCSIIGIAIFYLIMSFSNVLPWSVCDPSWADERCIEVDGNFDENSTVTNITNPQTSTEQYFRKFLLNAPPNIDDGIGVPDWRLVLCLAVAWLMMMASLFKGVKSSGKVAYVTALFPYLGLFILLIKGCTLPGATDGILYFITPQWEKLLEPQVWYAAVGQSFFSLSVAFGSIAMFSSHNKFRQTIYRDAAIISVMDTFTSLLGGFTIFSCLGYLKLVTGAEKFEDVVSGGTTLVFVTYPAALATFGKASQLFSVLFFLMLITLGVGSSTALSNTVITLVADKFPSVPKYIVTIIISVVGFLVGLVYCTPGGQFILDIVDFFAGTLLIYVIAIVEIVAIAWIFGYNRYMRDVRFMLGVKLGFYWRFCYMFFIPIGLTAVLIYILVNFAYPTYDADVNDLQFPDHIKIIGWILFAVPVSIIPFCYCYEVYKGSATGVAKKALEPFKTSSKYGPRLNEDRKVWNIYRREKGWKKLDYWKKLSKEALENSQKMNLFNSMYKNAKISCEDWDVSQEKSGFRIPIIGKK